MFTHLHAHSNYSFLRGIPSPQMLVQHVVRHEMKALALTDHHSLAGAIEFYIACVRANIQPILGLEVNVAPPNPVQTAEAGILVLLAMDSNGWSSLCRISSSLEGDEAILPFEKLAENTRGLICLSGGRRGSLWRLFSTDQSSLALAYMSALTDILHDRFYIEVQKHLQEDERLIAQHVKMGKQLHVPVVVTHDIHYLQPSQQHLQQVISGIRLNQSWRQLRPEQVAPPHALFKSHEDMVDLFQDFPAGIEATQEIVDRCRLELPLGVPHYPEISLPTGMSALDVLRQKAYEGARRFYTVDASGQVTREVGERLEHELQVIDQTGYAPLFLIVEEILSFARREGIPISSRGSAASSLVAHCLGITTPDPLRLNLYFERFLNPARATPPDIDTDLCSRGREKVIRYVYERFGQDRVATVCTINRFRSRSALREVAKTYGLPPENVSKLADSLPRWWYGPANRRSGEESPYAELEERYTAPLYKQIFQDATALIGFPHHLSVHPGGVVITPGPMTDLVPTQMATKGVRITQFDLESIEPVGLLKIDLLGIRGLTVLGDVAADEVRQERGGTTTGSQSLDFMESIPEEDPEVSEALMHGKTIGCFQIESPGMRATLREVRARSIDDLMIALALYRPGPLTGGLKDSFVRRHLGKEPASYLHPALEPLLDETHGVILYQEQVLRIAHSLAGLSLADADLLRRAMSHFDPGKQMKTLMDKFITGAWEKNQVPASVSEKIWELMAAFAGYGFPKAHAASYAQIGWRAAWCKVHYPAVFMTAVLANWGGYYSQRVYLTESRRQGLTLRSPLVNYADRDFSVKYLPDETGRPNPVLFMGLDQVKELTQRTIEKIQRLRPFRSLDDFLERVDPRLAEAVNLVKVGALDDLGTIPVLLEQISHVGKRAETGASRQMALFTLDSPSIEDWSLEEKVAAQEDLLGVSVIAHPLEMVEAKIVAAGALNTVDAAANLGKRVRVAGMRQTWRRSATARGDYIYFMALEDLEGMLDVIIFSEIYRRSREALSTAGPYIVEGFVEYNEVQGEPFIRAERIWALK